MTVTYLDARGREITEADARAFAEERLGRALTDGERHLDLVGLDLDLREGKERLVEAITAARRAAVEEYLRTGTTTSLRITPEIQAAMLALIQSGRQHAIREMRSMGLDVEVVEGDPFRRFAEGDLADRFGSFVEQLLRALTAIRVRIAGEADAAEFRGAGTITEELIEKLDERIPGARAIAADLSSGLFIGGLGEIYEHNADLFPCFTYSAVMDGATCDVCREFDGIEYGSWILGERDLPGGGPNPLCRGGGRCRCRLVPCPPGIVEPGPPEPPPEEPEEPVPANRGLLPLAPADRPPAATARRDVEDFLNEGAFRRREILGHVSAGDHAARAKEQIVEDLYATLRDDPSFRHYATHEGRVAGELNVGDEVRVGNAHFRVVAREHGGDATKLSVVRLDDPFDPTGERRVGLSKTQVIEGFEKPPPLDHVRYGATEAGATSPDERIRAAISALIKTWATTSANEHEWALAMQRAAVDEFGLDPDTTRHFGSAGSTALSREEAARAWERDSLAVYDEHGPALRAFLRHMWANTQRRLAAAGLDEVDLYRGQSIPADAIGDGPLARIESVGFQPMSSFAADFGTARSFGPYRPDADRLGLLASVRVPRERVIGSANTGYGCLDEWEFVILGRGADAPPDRAQIIAYQQAADRPGSESAFWAAVERARRGIDERTRPLGDFPRGTRFTMEDSIVEYEVVAIVEGNVAVKVVNVPPELTGLYEPGEILMMGTGQLATPKVG